ncbi:hypothetical protein L6452_10653 [Arctium lappa]|uniref:Uncharacterized protein n=1 Tax=Arctium lappa TaxID=4217 RepID=A0ACB9DNK7_ARCLA|nr:hypothetical protein L6452_10653 [Arctium lappa]
MFGRRSCRFLLRFFDFASRGEIEEGVLLNGSKPSRRPKKRPRAIQKQLDRLFPLLSDCWDKNSEQLDEYPEVTFPNLSSLDGYLRHSELTKSLEIKCSRLGLKKKGKSHVREHMENFMPMLLALLRKLLTSSKPIITLGDRMITTSNTTFLC